MNTGTEGTAIVSIAVFCGSGPGRDPAFVAAADKFGALLGNRGWRLVYGGGSTGPSGKRGMMGTVADGCLHAGGSVTGVIPTFLTAAEHAHPGVEDMRVVQSMAERKHVLINESDAFAILPGGIGTLDELFEVVTWNQLKLMNKPVVVVNTRGIFDGLQAWYERAIDEGFVPESSGGVPHFVTTPQEAIEWLASRLVAEPIGPHTSD